MTTGFRPCALICAYDASRTVGSVVAQARARIEPVLVVDDGSADDTAGAARRAGAHVIRHLANRGKGAALLTGLAAARERGYTHAVTLDADGQHDPADIPSLLAVSEGAPGALVVGARDFDHPNVPGASRFGRRFTNGWVKLETGRTVHDCQSGFRSYPVDSILALGLSAGRFEWEVDVIVRAAWAGIPLVNTPVSVFYAPAGQHTSHYRMVRDSVRMTLLHFKLLGLGLLRRGGRRGRS